MKLKCLARRPHTVLKKKKKPQNLVLFLKFFYSFFPMKKSFLVTLACLLGLDSMAQSDHGHVQHEGFENLV